MDTQEVERALRADCNLATIFEGVFPSDCIPNFCDSKMALVANFDERSRPGSHWIAMYIENGHCEYFDSYGRPPNIGHFINFIKRNSKTYSFNKDDLQALDSDVCGYYSIWFLSERARGKSMNQIVADFSGDHDANDLKVKAQVESRFKDIVTHLLDGHGNSHCAVGRYHQCCAKRRNR